MTPLTCTRNDIKKLTCYDIYHDLIDQKIGEPLDYLNFANAQIISDLVIQIQLHNNHSIYLPIIATENGHRALTEVEIQQAETLERQRKQAIMQIDRNARRINQRKAQSKEIQPLILTQEDKQEWWNFLEEKYPRNYALARRYYADGEDPALAQLGLRKQDYTVNEFFEIYGLPRIFTDQHHNIQVAKD